MDLTKKVYMTINELREENGLKRLDDEKYNCITFNPEYVNEGILHKTVNELRKEHGLTPIDCLYSDMKLCDLKKSDGV